MESEFDELDKILIEKYGKDPAKAVADHARVTTGAPFSIDAAPVVKNDIPVTVVDEVLPAEIAEPFIKPPVTIREVEPEDDDTDWQEEAEDLVDILDTMQAGTFILISGAKGTQRDIFPFSDKTKEKLARKGKPVAKKHNIKAPSELSFAIALGEALANNINVALEMRKANEATREATERAERAEKALAAQNGKATTAV